MLVLTRRINESIAIGPEIRITVTEIRGRQVRIAIEAPEDLTIMRDELLSLPCTPLANAVGRRRPS